MKSRRFLPSTRKSLVGASWRLEHAFAIALLAVVLAALWTSLGFPARSRFMPLLTGVPGAVLIMVFVLFQRHAALGEIIGAS